MVRRPHILKFKVFSGSVPVQNESGDWVVPELVETEKQYQCSAQPNGSGQTIPSNDGGNIVYSWIIYLDRNVEFINYGQAIEVYKGETLIASGNCKFFSLGQMNSRLWV